MPLIQVQYLHPDPRNANQCNTETLAKIMGHIQRNGFCPSLTVRPHPTLADQYMVLDGHHRLQIVKELGWETVDCQVHEIDDEGAALLLLTLNQLRGEDNPRKRAELMQSLLPKFDIATLSNWLPESRHEIEGLLALIQRDTEEQNERLQALMDAERKSLPVPFGFMIPADEADFVRDALQVYQARGTTDQGAALVAICRDALAIHATEQEDGQQQASS